MSESPKDKSSDKVKQPEKALAPESKPTEATKPAAVTDKPAEPEVAADAGPAQADPKQVRMLSEHKLPSPLIACRYDPKSRWVFAACEDLKLYRIPLGEGPVVTLGVGHDSWVRAMGFDPTGETLITGGYDGCLVWWPAGAVSPTALRKIDAHQGWIRALAVSPDGKLIATCGNDLLVKLWDLASGKLVRELPGHQSHVFQVAFDPSGQSLVSADLKGNFKHWNVADGKLVRDFAAPTFHKYDEVFWADAGGIRGLAFGGDGQWLGAGGWTKVTNAFAGVGDSLVVSIDWKSGKIAQDHPNNTGVNGVIWNLCWHADGYWIAASGGQTGYLLFFKPDAKHEFHAFKLTNTARDMDLLPSGMELAVAHFDKMLRRYRLTPEPPSAKKAAEKAPVEKTT